MVVQVNTPIESSGRPVSKLVVQSLMILVLIIAIGALAVIVGHFLFGSGIQVGVLAILVCSLSASLAHGLSEFPKGDEYALLRIFIGMSVRTAPPFLLALWGLYFSEPPLEKSLVLYIILLYLVGLLTDVAFNVSRLKNS